MRQEIPVQPIANQTLQVQLGTQPTVLEIYQTAYGMFINVFVGNSLIVAGVICENLNRIVRDSYLGFIGDLVFIDTKATAPGQGSDPVFTGLGSQYVLIWDDSGFAANLG